MTERIMTLHPAGKAGVNIDRQKYETVRANSLDDGRARGEIHAEEQPAAIAPGQP